MPVFKPTPYQSKKLRLHGLAGEWEDGRKNIARDRSTKYEYKLAKYEELVNSLMDKVDAIELGKMAPTPGSKYAEQPDLAVKLETQKGAPPTLEDCAWAFQNQGVKQCDLSTAPSQGAVALKERAEKDGQIYKWLLDRMTPKSLIDNDDTIDTRALDLTGIENNILDRWAKCQLALQDKSS